MPQTEIIWTPKALADLDEIFVYVAQDSIYQAERLVDAIIAKCQILLKQPLIGRVVFEEDGAVRQVLHGKYRILYEVVSLSDIEIVRVIHAARMYF